MIQTLILNIFIIALVLAALFVTKSPVVLLGLLALKHLPYDLVAQELEIEASKLPEPEQPMGFVQS